MFTVKNKENKGTGIQSKPLGWGEFFKQVKEDKAFREAVGATKSGKLSLEEKGWLYSVYLVTESVNKNPKYKDLNEEDRQAIIKEAAKAALEEGKLRYLTLRRQRKTLNTNT